MGDYNLNIFSPLVRTQERNCYLSQVHTYSDGRETVQVLTVQDQLTTLKKPNPNYGLETARGEGEGYANNFDHFTYSPERSRFVNVSYQTVEPCKNTVAEILLITGKIFRTIYPLL